jgi:cephalosporin-C deacetylase-like acetyl esterase
MRRAAAVVLATAAALAAGCGSDERPAAARKDAPPPLPRAQTVHFKASDGRRVTAQFAPAGANAPAVVLLHEIRGGPDQWDTLVPYLHEAGFATLAYLSRASVMERDRIRDALGALRWLRSRPDVDRRRLGLVGASIGASTTVYAMATGARRAVDAAVALSPPDSPDIWALQDHGRYRPHDLLMVSDERESTAVDGMMDGAVRSKALRSERPGHGVALLTEPAVRDALVTWLRERVRSGGG